MPSSNTQDEQYMRHALAIARRGLGRVAPNPSVGCVLVKNGRVIAAARTGDGGRPHAEALALNMAGGMARGATAYVTLEPCAHHGETPPCADALIKAGIRRVVIACGDPDKRVHGRGVTMLEDAGIEAITGVCAEEALALNAGFFKRITERRPYVTLKMAVSADENIARRGERTQISGVMAGQYMHHLRAQNDAVLIGAETAIVDNPLLSARIDGYAHAITRCVMDRHLRLSEASKLVQSASENPLIVFYEDGDIRPFKDTYVALVRLDKVTPESVLTALAERGVTRLMIEGGAQIATTFLQAKRVDEFHLIRSEKNIGDNGVSVLKSMSLSSALNEFELKEKQALSEDVLEIYAAKD